MWLTWIAKPKVAWRASDNELGLTLGRLRGRLFYAMCLVCGLMTRYLGGLVACVLGRGPETERYIKRFGYRLFSKTAGLLSCRAATVSTGSGPDASVADRFQAARDLIAVGIFRRW